eukprot:gnl/TRDRNA2_/TRDRNA2_126396_c1_seq2.p1 gnl/TRDRNA2_/TRDRNA2_126396_c1~~gnl/TRDRNA2_/TRDRNA2_126396_c1_seq2.p1  ORF type:complete len:277 (+),score=40.78 gnl/TRDRNA2_/TRDRNA2_126396_c1_seq2:1-831(+)
MLRLCPRARFVYNTRNIHEWLMSVLAWSFKRGIEDKMQYPFFPRSLFDLADRVTYGCGMFFPDASHIAELIDQRIAFEDNLGILLTERNSSGTPVRFMVWQVSESSSNWRQLFNFAVSQTPQHFFPEARRNPRDWRFECFDEITLSLVDDVLRERRSAITKHCTEWPSFCIDDAWAIPAANRSTPRPSSQTMATCQLEVACNMELPAAPAHVQELDWKELSIAQQNAAELLGYNQSLWDANESLGLESTAWADLREEQRTALCRLGFTEERWDDDE